jgi:hypothetical protein
MPGDLRYSMNFPIGIACPIFPLTVSYYEPGIPQAAIYFFIAFTATLKQVKISPLLLTTVFVALSYMKNESFLKLSTADSGDFIISISLFLFSPVII